MIILGVSAFYHDSAAALIVDGEIVAAAQEERFSRKKHDPSFPLEAIRYCLDHAKIDLGDIDHIVFYEKPLLKFERLLETYIAFAPLGLSSFRKAIPSWVKEKLFLPRMMHNELKKLPGEYKKPFVYTRHHESHAASAFFPSPFKDSAIVTIDGVGEWATTPIAKGNGNKIQFLYEQRFPHSLGLLYSAFTYYTGFRVNSGEYKLMGLAPYGSPKYTDIIEENLIHIREDGSFWMDMSYFNYCQGLTMTSSRFHDLFGAPPRRAESELNEFYMDVAASIQKTTEKVILRIVRHAHKITGCDSLCMAGGVALNCVANGRVLREGPFKNFWIQPAAGDAGGALGAAKFVWHQLLEGSRSVEGFDSQTGSYLGPQFSDEEIQNRLNSNGFDYEFFESDEILCKEVAKHLANEKVVGWFQGRMEFGPRALGARSILGDARSLNMQKNMNLKIKFRESFRPFAPSVIKERAHQNFEIKEEEESPYMLLVADVVDEKIIGSIKDLNNAKGLNKLNIERSELQAITHVDHSARIQTVDKVRHPLYYKLIKEFEFLTGCPVVINTSFNVRGEPIVCFPEEALKVFLYTNMDILVLGRCVLLKEKQPDVKQVDIETHLSNFALD